MMMYKEKTETRMLLSLLGAILLLPLISCTPAHSNWPDPAQILKNIQAPTFPDETFMVTDFGAKADGSLSTKAINNAIQKCNEKGGGTVVVPAGTFFTGAVHLLSNVNLRLEEGAVLSFSTDPADYLPLVYTRWEGIDCYNYSPLIYAYKQSNVALTGKGKIQGNASEDNWWVWKGKPDFGWNDTLPSQQLSHARPALDSYNENEIMIALLPPRTILAFHG